MELMLHPMDNDRRGLSFHVQNSFYAEKLLRVPAHQRCEVRAEIALVQRLVEYKAMRLYPAIVTIDVFRVVRMG